MSDRMERSGSLGHTDRGSQRNVAETSSKAVHKMKSQHDFRDSLIGGSKQIGMGNVSVRMNCKVLGLFPASEAIIQRWASGHGSRARDFVYYLETSS